MIYLLGNVDLIGILNADDTAKVNKLNLLYEGVFLILLDLYEDALYAKYAVHRSKIREVLKEFAASLYQPC